MMRTPLASALLLLLTFWRANAQSPSLTIPSADLAAFVDGMFDIQLKRDDAAGAVFLLTQNGTTLLSHGYGLADVRKAIPMTDRIIVRGGALTMPIIAVAVMQQVEAGKISLDADISRYIDLPLVARTDGPITVRELLTHTAGFAGRLPFVSAHDLRSYLALNPLARIYPAGALNSF